MAQIKVWQARFLGSTLPGLQMASLSLCPQVAERTSKVGGSRRSDRPLPSPFTALELTESEPPPQWSLPVAGTSDPQIPKCSRKESLNLGVHPKPILNKDHILHMYV